MRIFLAALLLSAATAASASDPPADKLARDLQNYDVIMKNYPPRALAAGEQGTVVFKITIGPDGEPRGCEVTGSSGYPRLDEETCQLMVKHGRFQRVKDKDGRFITSVHEGAVNWKHPNGPALSGKVAVAEKKDPLDKLVCRTSIETGTLAKKKRSCRTRREWQVMSDEQRDAWQEMQGRKGSSKGD